MKAKLTDALVRDLPAPERGQRRYWDAGMPGLILRMTAGGKRCWYYRQRHGARVIERRIGVWPALTVEGARQRVHEIAAQPVLAERPTLKEALRRHLAMMREKGRDAGSIRLVEASCESAMQAGIDDLTARDLPRQVDRWLASLTCSPITKKRHRVNLCGVIRSAMRWWPDAFPRDPLLALQGFTAPLPAP
ncbi:MAG: Arm DNA-binding domain-containing protein, partial [Planctomycetes bacterium]|nr:Arm DNA-binding domain-containing protein [Planctomycetota bacterium]